MADDRRTPVGSDPRHIDTVASVLEDMDLATEAELEKLVAEARGRGVGLLDAAREKAMVPADQWCPGHAASDSSSPTGFRWFGRRR